MSSRILLGKTALITGCNRGIGAELLRRFTAEGADVVASVREISPTFRNHINELSSVHGVNVIPISIDLKKSDHIKLALKELYTEKKKIDILINNAGIAVGGLLGMTSLESLQETFQVNFFSPVIITQFISKLMIRQGHGSIINIGSIAGLDNWPGYTAYGSSKAALMQFTKIISNELGPQGIRVNAIAPALIDTEMARMMENKAYASMLDRTSTKRLGKPEEIADVAVFLASDQSSFINGQIIRVDGGM